MGAGQLFQYRGIETRIEEGRTCFFRVRVTVCSRLRRDIYNPRLLDRVQTMKLVAYCDLPPHGESPASRSMSAGSFE